MDRRSRILLIVEGEKTEKRLFEKLFEEYGLSLEYEVYAYRTNIHDLCARMLGDNDDLDTVDVLGAIKEREQNPEMRTLLDGDYSDILLVFDYDPHDNRFSPEMLARMAEHFDESTDQGKLYVNYPMVESFKHFKALPDPEFPTRTVELSTLRHYKELVDRESLCTNLRLFDKPMLDVIIGQSTLKARRLCKETPQTVLSGTAFSKIDHTEIAHAQNKLVEHGLVSVLCTCLFFICDYNSSLVDWSLVRESDELPC